MTMERHAVTFFMRILRFQPFRNTKQSLVSDPSIGKQSCRLQLDFSQIAMLDHLLLSDFESGRNCFRRAGSSLQALFRWPAADMLFL